MQLINSLATFFILFSAVTLIGCAGKPLNSVPEPGWINNMHRLSAAHLYLMPKAASGAKFAEPAAQKRIAENLKNMAEASAELVKDPRAPNSDPLITVTADAFARDVRQTYTAFHAGDPQLARFSIGRLSRYCISCHTRADRGIRDFEMSWSSEIAGLTGPEKIDFYLANRHYKSALAEANKMAARADDPRRDPRGWLRAIKRTMAMVVRVNDNPQQAEELAYLAFSNKSAPNHLRREVMGWIGDIREWQADKKRKTVRTPLATAVNLLEVKPSFIRALRASMILHEILEDSLSPKYPEALLYAGMAAGAAGEFNVGLLDQYYFESCILRSPHTELAEKCYGRLEEAVQSANPLMSLDPDLAMVEQGRLAELRRLAEARDLLNDPKFMKREERSNPPVHGP